MSNLLSRMVASPRTKVHWRMRLSEWIQPSAEKDHIRSFLEPATTVGGPITRVTLIGRKAGDMLDKLPRDGNHMGRSQKTKMQQP